MAKREMKTRNVEETRVETEAPVEEQKKVVTGKVAAKGFNKLNIRRAPRMDADVVTTVDDGSELEIVDIDKANGDWYKVKVDNGASGFSGYCMKKFIKLI